MAPCSDCSDGFHHYIWLIKIAQHVTEKEDLLHHQLEIHMTYLSTLLLYLFCPSVHLLPLKPKEGAASVSPCLTVVPIVTGGAGRGAGGVEGVEVEAPPAGQAPGGGGAPGAPLTARLTAPAPPRRGVLEVARRAVADARSTARGRQGGTGGYGGNC